MWHLLVSNERYCGEDCFSRDGQDLEHRNSFHRDYDRLIFSNPFRRLSKKTQVHPLSTNDHVHNRLVHSLEVASVGRSLGLKAGELIRNRFDIGCSPYDVAYIVQTACLAHDIGNPPFGHAGEEVIKEWFKKHQDAPILKELTPSELSDFLHLDGNAQSFRVVSQLEHNPFKGGMRLTVSTLGTLVKYPYSSDSPNGKKKQKFNFFQSEQEVFNLVFEKLGLVSSSGVYKRHPLSFLMEASDDICYGLLDLQDAFELGLIRLDDLKDSVFKKLCDANKFESICGDSDLNDRQKLSKLVSNGVNTLVEETIESFETHIHTLSGEIQPKDIFELFENDIVKQGIENAKKISREHVFNERRKVALELGAYHIIETLLDNLIEASYQLHEKGESGLSFRNKRALTLMAECRPSVEDSLYNKYQRVLDYIIGMTDNHAKLIANQLNGIG